MLEWFDDLKLGLRFKSGETTGSREDIKRDVDGRDEPVMTDSSKNDACWCKASEGARRLVVWLPLIG